jgi:hypothetical protein
MSAALSRRVGRLIATSTAIKMKRAGTWLKFCQAIDAASTYSDLSAEEKRILIAAETDLMAGRVLWPVEASPTDLLFGQTFAEMRSSQSNGSGAPNRFVWEPGDVVVQPEQKAPKVVEWKDEGYLESKG